MAKANSLKAKQSVDDIDAALESNSIPIASIEDKDNDAKTDSWTCDLRQGNPQEYVPSLS